MSWEENVQNRQAKHVAGQKIRQFESGANRNSDEGKLDYDGFLSPFALETYAVYMHNNRFLADGTFRDSDNWQKGIPQDAYRKSLWRHTFDVWKQHRLYEKNGASGTRAILIEALCGVIFNAMGLLHELTAPPPALIRPVDPSIDPSLTQAYEVTPADKAALAEARKGWKDDIHESTLLEPDHLDIPLPPAPKIELPVTQSQPTRTAVIRDDDIPF